MNRVLLARVLRQTAVCTGTALLAQGCVWTDVYEQGQDPLETVQLFQVADSAVFQVILDDVNKDGLTDVVALFGPQRAAGDYMAAEEPGTLVKAWAGDGRGGFKPLVDLDVAEGRPTHLGVWHPQDANAQIAVYGTTRSGEGQVRLISVGAADVEGINQYNLGSSATQVALQATEGGSGGGQQLVVGGNFGQPGLQDPAAGTVEPGQQQQPAASSGQGEIMVLQDPQADRFTTLGPLDLPGGDTAGASPLAVADFNADGRLDVVSTNTTSAGVVLHLQNEDGTFQRQPPVAWDIMDTPVEVITGDFNGDGKPDVRVIFESCHDAYFVNQGGQLAAPSTFHTVMDPTLHAVVADLDGDQDKDLLLTGINGAVEVLLLDANGQVDQQSARRVVVNPDAASPVDGSAPLAVRVAQNALGKAARRAQALGSAFLPVRGEMVAAGADLNRDGRPDLVFGTNDGQVLLHQGR